MTDVDTTKWSGEGEFTQLLLDRLTQVAAIVAIRVEDAPASRADSDYNFVSNEIFVAFRTDQSPQPRRWLAWFRAPIAAKKAMTVSELEAELVTIPEIGTPDYSDEAMLQYLRTERVIPPYQTRGYKLVELVRIYEAEVVGGSSRTLSPGR